MSCLALPYEHGLARHPTAVPFAAPSALLPGCQPCTWDPGWHSLDHGMVSYGLRVHPPNPASQYWGGQTPRTLGCSLACAKIGNSRGFGAIGGPACRILVCVLRPP